MTSPNATREFTGRHMLLLTVGFFGVIISVNVGMAVLATTSWTGLVVKNSYVASQAFEEKRHAHEAQKAAGWTSELTFNGTTAALLVLDAAGEPVGLDEVRLEINRPVGGHDDQSLVLERGEDGAHAAPLTLTHGVWEARVTADTALGPFELHQRFKTTGGGT